MIARAVSLSGVPDGGIWKAKVYRLGEKPARGIEISYVFSVEQLST